MDLTSFVPVILTIHVLIVLALIGVVLLQRSEGGALGIGGGGGGFMSGRGAANVLTRSTSILAALFFVTSLSLAIIADQGETEADIIEDFTGVNPNANPNNEIDADSLIRSIGGSLGTQTDADEEPASAPVSDPATDIPAVDTLADQVPAEEPSAGEVAVPPAQTPARTSGTGETPPADEDAPGGDTPPL